jgi:hypothetical protein
VEYILQALWRTRRTGLDAADRAVVRDILQISIDSEIDPVRASPLPPFRAVAPAKLRRRGFIPQLHADAPLARSQLLVCLRILIRRCVHENVAKDDVAKLFPEEVLPELKRLLILLLHKFQPQWRQDASKDQVTEQQPASPFIFCPETMQVSVVI